MTGLFWLGVGMLGYLFVSFIVHVVQTVMNRLNPDSADDSLWCGLWPAGIIFVIITVIGVGASRISNWIANYVADWVAPMIASSKNEPEQLEVGETYRQPPHCSSCGKTSDD